MKNTPRSNAPITSKIAIRMRLLSAARIPSTKITNGYRQSDVGRANVGTAALGEGLPV